MRVKTSISDPIRRVFEEMKCCSVEEHSKCVKGIGNSGAAERSG